MISLGLQEFLKRRRCFYRLKLAVLVHAASVDNRLCYTVRRLYKLPNIHLRCLFGPQHGFFSETQDNMIEWKGFRDYSTQLPIYSLYGICRKPTRAMLKDVDVLMVDLQEIGARYYTYIWTMVYCLQACAAAGIKVVILDRPNPINGLNMEGGVLDPAFASFVGLYPLPIRHGMTLGEIACYINSEFNLGCDLEVIPMRGWRRAFWFDDTGLPWVMPSPNIPTLESAIVYPGMCLFEGTNISEGRGTTRPFEILGAPFIDGAALAENLGQYRLPGVFFRPLNFIPTFQKWSGERCGGVQIHVLNRDKYRSVNTACCVLEAIRQMYPRDFRWKKPPYEYEKRKMPIDILSGSTALRDTLDCGGCIQDLLASWEAQCKSFNMVREKYLIYR